MLGFLFNETLKYINVGLTCHCEVKLHKNARIEHKKTKNEILGPGERNDGD